MDNEKIIKVPGYIKILAWLISLSAFSIGFWHTHLGLKDMKPLSWEYGSLVVSGLVLLVLIVAYNRAIAGVKYAIFFYLLCASFMFIFNLNSFYPTYMGKKLIKEDASMLKDSLDKYATKLKDISGLNNTATFNTVKDLQTLKKQIFTELTDPNYQNKVGPFVRSYFDKFKNLSGSKELDLGSITIGKLDAISKEQTINQLMQKLETSIVTYIASQTPDAKNNLIYAEAQMKMDSLSEEYIPRLEQFMKDTAALKSLESARNSPEVVAMIEVATQFDQISRKVNTAKNKKIMPIFYDNDKNQVSIPLTQELGKFAHTINAIFKHINKIDTWGILILCFFIDFIVPIAIFFMLKDNNGGGPKIFKPKPQTF